MRNECKDCKFLDKDHACLRFNPPRFVNKDALEPWRQGTELPVGCFEKKIEIRQVIVTVPEDCPFRGVIAYRENFYGNGCGLNGKECENEFPDDCPLAEGATIEVKRE